MKTSVPYSKLSYCALLLIIFLSSLPLNAQTPALEFTSGAGNPGGNGPVLTSQLITFQNNTNNPAGNTFAAYTPTLTATFSLSNQQYSLTTGEISTGKGLSFGANLNASGSTAAASGLFPLMNLISSPSNSNFTSSPAVTAGAGIDMTTNRTVALFTSARALDNANASTSGRFYFGDLTITFNQTVTNPVIQIVGLGGFYTTLGFSTELELQNTGIVLSKLSGSAELTISSGTKILNSAAHPNSPTGSGAATGSILATGSGITSLSFKIYMRGDGGSSGWCASNQHTGDLWMIGVSLSTPVILSGNVYDDADGLVDGKVDGTGTGTPGSTQLYANLLNNGGVVLNSTTVSVPGAYTFGNVASNTNYTVQLSTTQGTIGQAAPASILPSGWVNTGENVGSGPGNDGSADSRLAVSVGSLNVTNVNFGIEQLPDSDPKWFGIPAPALNSFITLNNSGYLPGPLSGSDTEDGILGVAKKVAITSLPTGGNQLWYNGVQITNGADGVHVPSVSNPYVIANYTSSLLMIKFIAIGSIQCVFNYAYYDAAGLMDPTPASYTLEWFIILPVKLISFSAMLNNNKVDLKWTTTAGTNLNRFVIEKSIDGKNFIDAGVVLASSMPDEKKDYSLSDADILNKGSIIYYRLKMIDTDQKIFYSDARIIRLGEEKPGITVTAYPNPVVNDLSVSIPSSWQNKNVRIALYNSTGTKVKEVSRPGAGQTEVIAVNDLVRGLYILKASFAEETAQQKIVKN